MALTVPNLEATPTFDAQALFDATDISSLALSEAGTAVLAGCGVTAATGLTVTIASGTIMVGGIVVSVTGTTKTAGAASTFDRKDIVVVNSSGTISITAGTPCTVAGWTQSTSALPPVKPAIPANSVLLAELYIASTTTTIVSGNIIDKTTFSVLPATIHNTATWTGTTLSPSAGEFAVFTGTAASTVTLPASPTGSPLNTVTNSGTAVVTVDPGAGATLNAFGTVGNYTLNPGNSIQVVFIGTVWYVIDSAAHAFASNFASGNIAVSATTYTNLASVTLAAGTWHIVGQALLGKTSTTNFIVDVFLGPTSTSKTGAYMAATAVLGETADGVEYVSVPVHALVTLTASTTVYLEAYSAGALTDAYFQSIEQTISNATGITAVRIA